MINQNELTRSIRFALIAGFAIVANSAFAQTDAEAKTGAAAEKLDEIVVTGTRIQAPNAVSNSPITSFTKEDIDKAQPVAVEQFIKLLPGAVPAIGPGTNNGSDGGAQIDLRGLGSNRTLVLVDGRRVTPYSLSGVVDTNSIPIALVERVDLVTGGASAVYGADAISGVVNFVLRRDFEGAELNTSYGESGDGDGSRQRTDLTIGGNFAEDRGNVVFSFGKTKTTPVYQGDRDFSLVSRDSTTGGVSGSGTTVPAVIRNNSGLRQTRGQIQADGTLSSITQRFNFNPYNLFQTPLDRYQATALGHFEFIEGHEVYGSVNYTRSNVETQVAPSGTFGNSYLVPIGNPFISQSIRNGLCTDLGILAANCVVGNPTEALLTISRRFVEAPSRISDYQNKTFQGTVGLKGDISDSWQYDAYWSHGEANQVQSQSNNGLQTRAAQALRAISTTECLDPANGCVPLNVFGPAGSLTSAMFDFINTGSISTQAVTQDVWAANATGDFGDSIQSPWAEYPAYFALGLEYREVGAKTFSDAAAASGDVLGNGAANPNLNGAFDLTEGYVEVLLPVVTDASWAYAVNFEGGFRRTKFSTTSDTSYNTYKYGGEWAFVENFRLRALAQRATRAPNVNELFSPEITGLDNLSVDPCQGTRINAAQANTPGTLANLCRLTGVPLGVIGSLDEPSAGQANVFSGGNRNLGPEIADTLTVGFVWSPFKELTATLDYYKIDLEKTISSPSVDDVIDGCYSSSLNPGLGFNASCALVGRSSVNGSFNGVESRGIGLALSNLGVLSTDGIDVSVNYRYDLQDWGLLGFAWNANHVFNSEFQATPTSENRDCVGLYSVACGNIVYDYKSNFSTNWSLGAWGVGLNWRYVSSLKEETGEYLPAYSTIGSHSYFDLSANWRINENVRLNLTVDNLFDKAPPEVGSDIGSTSVNSGNTFPTYYDTIGRFYTLGVNVAF